MIGMSRRCWACFASGDCGDGAAQGGNPRPRPGVAGPRGVARISTPNSTLRSPARRTISTDADKPIGTSDQRAAHVASLCHRLCGGRGVGVGGRIGSPEDAGSLVKTRRAGLLSAPRTGQDDDVICSQWQFSVSGALTQNPLPGKWLYATPAYPPNEIHPRLRTSRPASRILSVQSEQRQLRLVNRTDE